MSGLILFFILCAWGFASYSLARHIVSPIKNSNVRVTTNIVVVALIFVAPVADEIIGGFQFRKLCNEGAVIKINEKNALGKTVISVGTNSRLLDYILPINKINFEYKDITTNEILVSWDIYDAEGGWLSHIIGFPQSHPPYTFNGHCAPSNYWNIKKKLHLNLVN